MLLRGLSGGNGGKDLILQFIECATKVASLRTLDRLVTGAEEDVIFRTVPIQPLHLETTDRTLVCSSHLMKYEAGPNYTICNG